MNSEQRLFIAESSSTYVLSIFCELHFRTPTPPPPKKNRFSIKAKPNTLQAKIYNSEHRIAFGVIPEIDLDVILYMSFLPLN